MVFAGLLASCKGIRVTHTREGRPEDGVVTVDTSLPRSIRNSPLVLLRVTDDDEDFIDLLQDGSDGLSVSPIANRVDLTLRVMECIVQAVAEIGLVPPRALQIILLESPGRGARPNIYAAVRSMFSEVCPVIIPVSNDLTLAGNDWRHLVRAATHEWTEWTLFDPSGDLSCDGGLYLRDIHNRPIGEGISEYAAFLALRNARQVDGVEFDTAQPCPNIAEGLDSTASVKLSGWRAARVGEPDPHHAMSPSKDRQMLIMRYAAALRVFMEGERRRPGGVRQFVERLRERDGIIWEDSRRLVAEVFGDDVNQLFNSQSVKDVVAAYEEAYRGRRHARRQRSR